MANGTNFFNQPSLLQGGSVEGLLGNPLFTGGLGLLAGALDDDVGTADTFKLGLLGAQQGFSFQNERLKNEAAREQLLQQLRQQAARQRLLTEGQPVLPGQGRGFGLLTPSAMDDRATFDLRQDMGLLAEAAPEMVFGEGGLFAKQFEGNDDPLVTLGNGMQVRFSELPSDSQQLIAAGMNPGTDEFNETIKQAVSNGAATEADMIMATANATMAQLEAKRELDTERKREFAKTDAVRSSFRNLREMAAINDRLRGTIAETGVGLDEFRASVQQGISSVKSLLGTEDSAEATQVSNDVKRFETLALKENIANIEKLRETVGGQPTQSEFFANIGTGPGPSQPADVNNQLIADQLDEFKRLAEFEDIEVPKWVDEEIDALRNPGSARVGDIDVKPRSKVDLGDGFTLEFQ
jgi:hypothetical protein